MVEVVKENQPRQEPAHGPTSPPNAGSMCQLPSQAAHRGAGCMIKTSPHWVRKTIALKRLGIYLDPHFKMF